MDIDFVKVNYRMLRRGRSVGKNCEEVILSIFPLLFSSHRRLKSGQGMSVKSQGISDSKMQLNYVN